MKKQNGFTLIELVVVIAILGILAAIALPKFVSMTSEARIAKMKGGAGAINSGAALIHAKWLAMGSPTVAATVVPYDGGQITVADLTAAGYPKATVIRTVAGLGSDFVNGTAVVNVSQQFLDATGSACAITYDETTITVDVSALTAANCK